MRLHVYEMVKSWLKTPWSTQSVVRKDEREWRKFNHYRQRYALSKFRKDLLFAGEHPFRFLLSLILLFVAALLLIFTLQPHWPSVFDTIQQRLNSLDYFTTLWAVQVTLVVLVYPIVIGFATMFLQRRPAAETFIHLYILDSGALAAGLSSLLLVIVMATQYVLLSIQGLSLLPFWVVIDALWFLLNAVFTTFFLYRTIEFLRPEVQSRVVRQYTINIALPRDMKRLYSFQVLARAQTEGWIPAPEYGYEEEEQEQENEPIVNIRRYFLLKGEDQGIIEVAEPARLINVRLWPLRLVVSFWLAAARRWSKPKNNHLAGGNKQPLLMIPLTPGTVYQGPVPMTRVSDGPRLFAWQLFMLRLSCVFRPLRWERFGIQVESIFKELEADVREALNRADTEAFEYAFEAFISLHELLLGASLFENDDGLIDSWAMLPDIEGILDRRLYVKWADSYRSIFIAAITIISKDTRPLRRLCHSVQFIQREQFNALPVEIRENLLGLPPILMHELGMWWTHRIEEQGITEHGSHQMVVPDPPLNRIYENAVSIFIGGWEGARDAVAQLASSTDEFEWQRTPQLARLYLTHVQATGRMLIAAVDRGDQIAAEWLADVLMKWWGTLEYEQSPFVLYGKTDFLTIKDLEVDWGALSDLLGLGDDDIRLVGDDTVAVQRGVVLAALKNLWIDIRLIVIELLISRASQDGTDKLDNSLAVNIAAGLLLGKQWRSGGELADPLSGIGARDYLLAKVRQYAASGEWRGGYIGILDQFVDRVKSMQRPDMVTGRVYTFTGADDIASLQDQQLVIFIVLSSSTWNMTESMLQKLDIWMSDQYRSIEVFRERLDMWIDRLSSEALSDRVIQALISRTGQTHELDVGLDNTKRSIENIQEEVEAKRGQVLADAEIDPNRLLELANFSSEKAFDPQLGTFPIQLFDDIDFSEEELNEFTLTARAKKGELTHIEMDQRAANEEEFWAETMSQHVGAVILNDVVTHCRHRDIYTPDADAYWHTIQHEVAKFNQPILVLDNPTRPNWVWDWRHSSRSGHDKPDDLLIRRREGYGKGYVCHFNDIAVYSAPISAGQSILMSRETFQKVTFTKFDDGRFVDVTFKEHAKKQEFVDLKFKFCRDVKLGQANEMVNLFYESDPVSGRRGK